MAKSKTNQAAVGKRQTNRNGDLKGRILRKLSRRAKGMTGDMLAGELENKRDYVKQYIFEADLKEK